MPKITKENLLQSIIAVETDRAEDSTNADDNRQGHRLIYTLPSDNFFNPGVAQQHENAGPSHASAPWIEDEGVPLQQPGRQASQPATRVLNAQCHGQHVYEEAPQSHHRPQRIFVEAPTQRHHFTSPNLG